jgi:hypothetical protein
MSLAEPFTEKSLLLESNEALARENIHKMLANIRTWNEIN